MRQPPRGTVTFLFTDIEGSTRLWQDHPDQMCLALLRHDQLLRQAIEQHDGHLVKTTGDGVHAAFATAPDALAAALDAQRAVQAEPWDQKTPISVRIGLHSGNAQERDGDYYGLTLNRAARLMAAGHGGQVLISAAAQELMQDQLPPDATLRNLGDAHLKDLTRPEHVFQLLHPSLPADFPPLRCLASVPNNLPQQVTSFIGREKELTDVKALLAKARLLTLTGSGGCGKTRLSLQVATDVLEQYEDGVWLVELAPLSDPSLVLQTVIQVLGVREQAGKTLLQTLIDWLKVKCLLLVLDNCEHLVAACAATAADLLRNCPNVRLLATSREPLNVAGEQTFRVPSLSLPDPSKIETVESLSQYEAVRLFIERAQAVQPTFSVTERNAPNVVRVCFHLDGIPLAVELAAACVRSLPVEQINTRLDQRFRLLTGGARDTLPRQQTLRALIDWSYDLLTDQEKALLRRLSVFAGGWTLGAAEAVCSGEDIEDFEVLGLLTSLVDKSLVVYEEREEAEVRYRLLETMHQYAGERLAEEAGTVGKRHATWCLALVERAEPQLAGPEQGTWLSRLEAEHDNLRAAMGWYEQATEQRAQEGLRLAGALWRFWWVRGHLSEGRQWMNKALGRTTIGSEASAARAKALHGAGVLASRQGEYEAARALHQQSLTIRRRLGDQNGIAVSLNNLGIAAYRQGEYEAARVLHEESLAIRREFRDQIGISASLHNLGNVARRQGEYEAARVLHEESLAIERQSGDQGSIAKSFHCLGNLALVQGDLASARPLYEQSLVIARQLEDQEGIAKSLHCLGIVAAGQNDFTSAQTLYKQSLGNWQRLGHQGCIADLLGSLGDLASATGDYASARVSHKESLTIRRSTEDKCGVAYSLEGIAQLAHRQNQLSRAVRLWGAGSSLRENISTPLPYAEQEQIDQTMYSVRASLGHADFIAAWSEGQAMTLEQAVEYALSAE